jgi:hypothetical protein
MITAYDGLRYASFNEWKELGYSVQKGQTSYMVTEDTFQPLFSEKQVYQRSNTPFNTPLDHPDPSYDEIEDLIPPF